MSASYQAKELLKKIFVDNLEDAVAPEYRGAPYPPFDPLHINTKRIPDNMRAKYILADDGNAEFGEFSLYWQTQEAFDEEDFEKFLEEVRRCIEYQLNYYNVDFPRLTLSVSAESRDGEAYGSGFRDLHFEQDSIIESLDNKDIYYYGFIGGGAGNYFDGDYFEIIRNNDNTFSWIDCEKTYSSGEKIFKSRRKALGDAIKTIKPDDGSEFIVKQDPSEVYELVYPKEEDIYIADDIL